MYIETQILLTVIHYIIQGVVASPDERRLIHNLLNLNGPITYERPVLEEHTPLKVEFQVTLRSIIDVDETRHKISTDLWLDFRWKDYKFQWNPKDFGNITEIRLPQKEVWKPDILMYNSADPANHNTYPVNVVVYSDGTLTQTPPGIFTSSCPIDIKWFPFDDQECMLQFGSWTYDGTKIELQIKDGMKTGSLDGYSKNSEWELVSFPVVRNVVLYDCCPNNPYIDINYTIKIRRKRLYYIVNIIAPCILLSALTLVTFAIPPSTGAKVSFGMTILLTLTVFMLMMAGALPPSSDTVPLIARYFGMVMLLNAASVVFSVVVMNCHHRTSKTHNMPRWANKNLCWLAWILRVRRPNSPNGNPDMNAGHKSLLRNRDDGNCYMNGTDLTNYKSQNHEGNTGPAYDEKGGILKELRFITDRIKTQDADDQMTSDWKFAAAVIDRFLLCIFLIVTVAATLGILLAAPNVFGTTEQPDM